MKIEIVTHCWNYYRCLMYQLGGFVESPPEKCEVKVTVCASKEDENTSRVIDNMLPMFDDIKNVSLNPHWMDTNSLMRRSIGRNEIALSTDADWVWYADCDMVIYGVALDRWSSVLSDADNVLYYPKRVMINSVHSYGDDLISAVDPDVFPAVLDRDVSLWSVKKYGKAIGGVQICNGEHLRNVGYLPQDSRLLKSSATAKGFARCVGDRVFRSYFCGHRGIPVSHRDFRNGIYRIRHSECGRVTKGLVL